MTRPIRSFVLRQGRTTPAQQRALDALLPVYGISFPDKIKSEKALVLEIDKAFAEATKGKVALLEEERRQLMGREHALVNQGA